MTPGPLKLDRLMAITNAVNAVPWPSDKALAERFGISASRVQQVLKRAIRLGIPVLGGETRRRLRSACVRPQSAPPKGGEPLA